MSLRERLEPDDLSDEVREEIAFYLEMRAREFEEAGLDPRTAWREAVRAFGDPERIRKRVVREARMKRWMTKVRE
ncbi:MAG TPA: permease prefix domain 1-containing protein, partial [Longimicrobiales bacterium]|nr:permease prefix domain 1-containing protein [Longimicrobiales bacterium]